MRTTASLLQRIGAINCLTFHPLKLLLAGGAGDGVVALYNIHDGGGAGGPTAPPQLAMDSVGSSAAAGASPTSAVGEPVSATLGVVKSP